MVKKIKELVYQTARLWIRYSPLRMGKIAAWNFTSWRLLNYSVKTKYDTRMVGNTQDIIQKYIRGFKYEAQRALTTDGILRKGF
jgi:hypothetical protein